MKDHRPTPTVSRVLEDGTLVELLYDPVARATSLAVCRPGQAPSSEQKLELPSGERLAPYSATNSLIASECILLPSDVVAFAGKDALLAEVCGFLRRYVELTPTFEEIAAHYVLLSWVYDRFSELPYLRLRGDFGTGKTRALLAIGSLCYKPFFASGASTVSPIFHILENFQGTLILDEADLRFSDATAQLTKILNNGTVRGFPVLRTMTNKDRELNPRSFRVYGPKVIAMRKRFGDVALESRFITEETGGRRLRADVPIHVPESLAHEARDLRNQLLAWRFSQRAQLESDPTRLSDELGPRASQTALSLLSLIDDPSVRAQVCSYVGAADAQVRSESDEALDVIMLEAIEAAFARSTAAHAPLGMVVHYFNEDARARLGKDMTHRWVGHYVRTRFGLGTSKSNGVSVILATFRPRVRALADRAGIASEDGSAHNARSAVSENEPPSRMM